MSLANLPIPEALIPPQPYVEHPLLNFTRSTPKWRFNEFGLLEEVAAGKIAYDFDPVTGELKGRLYEEGRENLILHSEDFSQSEWTKENTTISVNQVVSPDGTNTADKLIEDTTNNLHGTRQDVDATNTNLSSSVFLKAAGRDRVLIINASSGSVGAYFDLSSGTVVSQRADTGATIDPVGDGWYRCKIITDNTSGFGSPSLRIYLVESGTTISYVGDGSSGVYIWGGQFEDNDNNTSYMPTDNTTFTRNADIANFTDLSWYNQSEGTFVIELAYNFGGNTTSGYFLTNGNSHRIYYDSGYNGNASTYDGTNINNSLPNGTLTENEFSKVAVGIKNDKSVIAVDGALGNEGAFNPATLTQLDIGANYNGHIKSLLYYPRRISDAELQEVTR